MKLSVFWGTEKKTASAPGHSLPQPRDRHKLMSPEDMWDSKDWLGTGGLVGWSWGEGKGSERGGVGEIGGAVETASCSELATLPPFPAALPGGSSTLPGSGANAAPFSLAVIVT